MLMLFLLLLFILPTFSLCHGDIIYIQDDWRPTIYFGILLHIDDDMTVACTIFNEWLHNQSIQQQQKMRIKYFIICYKFNNHFLHTSMANIPMDFRHFWLTNNLHEHELKWWEHYPIQPIDLNYYIDKTVWFSFLFSDVINFFSVRTCSLYLFHPVPIPTCKKHLIFLSSCMPSSFSLVAAAIAIAMAYCFCFFYFNSILCNLKIVILFAFAATVLSPSDHLPQFKWNWKACLHIGIIYCDVLNTRCFLRKKIRIFYTANKPYNFHSNK